MGREYNLPLVLLFAAHTGSRFLAFEKRLLVGGTDPVEVLNVLVVNIWP